MCWDPVVPGEQKVDMCWDPMLPGEQKVDMCWDPMVPGEQKVDMCWDPWVEAGILLVVNILQHGLQPQKQISQLTEVISANSTVQKKVFCS